MRASYCAPSGKVLLVSALIFLSLLAPGNAFCAGPKKVALFPFEMNSSQNLEYLQNGMFSMLSSRLTDPGKVTVLGRDVINQALTQAKSQGLFKSNFTQAAAGKIGQSLGADYVIFGSITVIGESVSLDAALADVKGEREPLTFSDQSKVMGDVITLVNNFAVTANQNVFNRRMKDKLKPISRSAIAAASAGAEAGTGDDQGLRLVEQPDGSGFSTHLNVKDVVRAMAVGDLNNNGQAQVVTATEYTLSIHHLKGSRLALEQTLEYPSSLSIVGLDIADINGNGYPEIFVSAMTIHQDSLSSFVVEFNGSTFTTITEKQPLYFKVVHAGENSKMLLGQEKGMDPFSGDIYLMTGNRGGYLKDKRIPMPRDTSVLALDRGAVRSGDVEGFLSVNRHGRIVVGSNTGERVWKSKLKYGGTNKIWLMEREDEDESYREQIYFNPRVKFLETTGKDGVQQAIVIRNGELMGGTLGRYKRFEQGHLEIMAWNGMEMAPVYKTTPVQGWISDFDIADLDNDGKPELLVSVVGRSEFAIFAMDKSTTLISYDLALE